MEPLPLARLLTVAVRLLVDEMHERLAAAGYDDLRPAHGYVLNAAADGGTTASAVAGLLGMTKQGAAKVIDELAERGYVERTTAAGDARARPVVLTRRGRAALAAAAKVQGALEQEWATVAGARDVAALRRALERVTAGATSPLKPVW